MIDINRSQEILRGVAGIKSILWILAILRGVYGVVGSITYGPGHIGMHNPCCILLLVYFIT